MLKERITTDWYTIFVYLCAFSRPLTLDNGLWMLNIIFVDLSKSASNFVLCG